MFISSAPAAAALTRICIHISGRVRFQSLPITSKLGEERRPESRTWHVIPSRHRLHRPIPIVSVKTEATRIVVRVAREPEASIAFGSRRNRYAGIMGSQKGSCDR